MSRKKDRSPEEMARREKIRELLQLAKVGSMDDIHELFKETIGEFMENGLEAELDEELGYSSTFRLRIVQYSFFSLQFSFRKACRENE